MHVRGGSQWKQRRDPSIGPLRRAHPASGATWNVQVVRGKMSTRCLWHACRALMVGILLMIIGAGMATIGYYSQDFMIGEFRNNTTIRIKNEQRGLHLNNMAYLGPVIMGVGGFIVVASCVMTFEARDSAAKVVPARFKVSGNSRSRSGGDSGRRTTSVQSAESRQASVKTTTNANRWEQHLGLFKSSSPGELPTDRHALTAALIHFSRTLGSPKSNPSSMSHRSGSVPNLSEKARITSPLLLRPSGSPNNRRISRHHHNHHHHNHRHHGSMVQRTSRENSYLHPGLLRYHRHAISVDETSPLRRQFNDSTHGSQCSVTFDPTPEIIDIAPVHKKRHPKRSDTARRHTLSRQKPIEKEEHPPESPHVSNNNNHNSVGCGGAERRRRCSTMSDSVSLQKAEEKRIASTSNSFDSRCSKNASSFNDLCMNGDEKQQQRKVIDGSDLSIERDCRSQLSICSEPMATVKQLSCQSSIEPCLLEEEVVEDDVGKEIKAEIESTIKENPIQLPRPDSLILNTATIEEATSSTSVDTKKFLYRSQSTRSFKKPKLRPSKLLSSDLDQIYVISSNSCKLDDFYDSIEVISERRNKNFMVEKKSEKEVACDDNNGNSNGNNNDEIVVVDIES